MRTLSKIAISQRRVPVRLHTRRIQAESLTGSQTLQLSHFQIFCLGIKNPQNYHSHAYHNNLFIIFLLCGVFNQLRTVDAFFLQV
jgi:hypothetical protein